MDIYVAFSNYQEQSSSKEPFNLPVVWEQVKTTADVVARKEEIEDFNQVQLLTLDVLHISSVILQSIRKIQRG